MEDEELWRKAVIADFKGIHQRIDTTFKVLLISQLVMNLALVVYIYKMVKHD